MAIPFLQGIDVTGTVDLSNLTIDGAQGTNGQVLTSTGQGIGWQDASGGSASLSGGEASKVAVWSATDTLTHNDNFHFDTTNVRLGIGDSNPNRTLVVSETRTGSTASDAYTAIVKSVQSSGASPNPGTGGLKVQYTSSSSNVHAFGLVAGSSSSDFLTTGPMHFYTNSDLDTVSATGFAMQLDTSQRLILGSTTGTQKLNVDGNVKANRYYGHSSTAYYVDPDDGTASAILNGAVSVGSGSVYTKFTVSTPAGYGDGADGIFIRSQFAGGSPVVSDKDPFLSIGCADSSSAVSTIFMGQDATATSQETKIEYSHDNDTLSIYKSQMGSYVEHVRFGNINSSGTARTRFYGNVGIGTNPSEKLHVSGGKFLVSDSAYTEMAVDQTDSGKVKIGISSGTAEGFFMVRNDEAGHVASAPEFKILLNDSEKLRLDGTGLGIGTNNPGYKLDVQGQIRLKNPNHQVIFHDTDSGVDEWSITTYSNTGLSFFDGATTGSPVMTLLSGGNVGINVTNPGFKLDVSGTARATSDFRAPRFYDTDDTAYYLDPASTSLLRHVDFKNGGVTKWYRSGANALQRADARVENSTTARLHWYGSNDSGGNTAFQHAWYDGSNYINVTASNPGVITFAGSAASMYIGSDRVFDDGYHPNADQWTTGRTLTIGSTGKTVTGGANVSWTLAEIGAAAAGDENIIDGATSIWNADGDGDVFTYNDANPTHNGDTVGAVINIKGDGAEFGSLVRAGQYTADHVSVSRGYYVGAALNTTDSTTQKVIDNVGNLIVGPDTVDIRSGTISVGGDANTYYPVVWYYSTQSQAFLNRIQIYRNYNETAPNSWNTSTHKGGLLLDLQANWGGWGGVNYDIKVNEFSELYSTMVGKISHFANSRGFAIWLRGGTATYHFYTEGPTTNPTVQLSAYDPGNNSTGVSGITSLDTGNINNRLYFRGGTLYSQNSQVLTVANEGSGNGIDADTVDGIQGGSFLRSDANDSFTGSELHFPTLDLSISNNNAQNQGNTYFRGTSTHFVLGLNNGNTCYLNYGNSSGALRLYGSSIYWNDSNIGAPWGSSNDGSGSGLDADLLDGAHKTSFLYNQGSGDFRTDTGGSNSPLYIGNTPTTNVGSSFINLVKQNNVGVNGMIRFYISPANTTNATSSTFLKHQFESDGDAHHDGDVIAYSTSTGSDRKLKKNIRDLEGALDKTLKLRGVKFDWKDENKANDQLGFIAQEVESVIPEVVKEVKTITKDDETHLTVNYPALVPLLVEAIKEQQKQIDELKSIINGSS